MEHINNFFDACTFLAYAGGMYLLSRAACDWFKDD